MPGHIHGNVQHTQHIDGSRPLVAHTKQYDMPTTPPDATPILASQATAFQIAAAPATPQATASPIAAHAAIAPQGITRQAATIPHRAPPAPTIANPSAPKPSAPNPNAPNPSAPNSRAANPSAREIQQLWSTAMTVVANKYAASMAHLPPAERQAAQARAAVLNRAAGDLVGGNLVGGNAPPGLRAGDLGTATAI